MKSVFKRSLIGSSLIVSVLGLFNACGNNLKEADSRINSYNVGDRPPQVVLLAFDGSLALDRWENTRQFAKNNKINFSYYVNCVYFLSSENKSNYIAPKKGAGKSAIGFGGNKEAILARLIHLNQAKKEGNEIASHACGHYNAQTEGWTEENWKSEFKQFANIMDNVVSLNSLKVPADKVELLKTVKSSGFVGFRAPELGVTSGLWSTLKKNKFKYDLSKVGSATYWPEKKEGFWNIPLTEIKNLKNGRSILAMDYNFYMSDSKAASDSNAANQKKYEENMYSSYIKYFEGNYYGNRAPVQIGHHFSNWNGGAYWKAMQRFAKNVCSRPEVKCITVEAYANMLDSLSPNVYTAWKTGKFTKKTPDSRSLISSQYISDLSADKIYTTEELNKRGLYVAPANADEIE